MKLVNEIRLYRYSSLLNGKFESDADKGKIKFYDTIHYPKIDPYLEELKKKLP